MVATAYQNLLPIGRRTLCFQEKSFYLQGQSNTQEAALHFYNEMTE